VGGCTGVYTIGGYTSFGPLYADFRGMFGYLCIEWSGAERFWAAGGYSINIFNSKLIPANDYGFSLRTSVWGKLCSDGFLEYLIRYCTHL